MLCEELILVNHYKLVCFHQKPAGLAPPANMNSTNLQVLTQISRALIIQSDMAALLIKPGINTIRHVVIER